MIPLRPLTLGDLLGGAFSAMSRYWKPLFGTAVIAYGAALVAVLGALLIAYLAVEDSLRAWFDHLEYGDLPWEDGRTLLTALGAVVLFSILLMMFSTAVVYAATSAVVQDAVLGRPATFGAIWRRAWSRMPSVLGTVLLTSLIAGAPMLAFGVVMLGLLAASAGEGQDAAGTLFGIWALLMLASLPVTVWLWVRFCLAPAAAVFEEHGPVAALRRSARLVQGSWWRTFGIGLLTIILAAALGYIIQLPFSIVGAFTMLPGMMTAGADPSPSAIYGSMGAYLGLSMLGGAISQIVQTILPQLVASLLYVDQRIRRESLDLRLAEAAGMPMAGPPQR
ncbi:hypothetical protein [Streptomyces sp. NPDC051219]|uniref:DUF7847 domain-containing protein n=1 Tax=Streptomyces sp. NPDC051219 TaxID=3155283 RepID=UPI003423F236